MKKENRTNAPVSPTGEAGATESIRKSRLLMQALVGIAIQNGIHDYQALADKAGMKRPQVSRYAAGKVQPSLENFMRLATAAGAKISIQNDLMEGIVIEIK